MPLGPYGCIRSALGIVALAALVFVPHSTDGTPTQEAIERLQPRYARVDTSGVGGKIETVWQRPKGEPKGIFFIAHGCNHQGTDIFSNTGHDGHFLKNCTSTAMGTCLGLPEEIRLRQAARARDYVVVAVSGTGRSKCWNMDIDPARVALAIRHVQTVEGLAADLPILASGASSGGSFVGLLAAPLDQGGLPNLQCIVPQIMGINGRPNRGVPALFVHMPRDGRTARRVQKDMQELKSKGIRTAEIRVEPVPITAALLKPCLGDIAEEAVQALVRKRGLLDDHGFLQEDPRRRSWVGTLQTVLAAHQRLGGMDRDTLKADKSCVTELLNVAWAQHEFTSQFAEQMLDFCEEVAPHSHARWAVIDGP